MPDHLIAELEALGADLDWPDVPDLSSRVRMQLVESAGAAPRRTQSGRWLAVAVAAGLLVAAVLVVPGPREAVARWLGVAGVRISGTAGVPPEVTSGLRLGAPTPVDEITAARPDELGPPTAAFTGEPSPDAVTLLWAPTDELPAVGSEGRIGLLLTQFRGQTARPLLEKQIGPDATVENTTVAGTPAFWITGAPHFLTYIDADGNRREDTVRLAANTLLWSDGGVTYRMESALDRDAAIALAESLR